MARLVDAAAYVNRSSRNLWRPSLSRLSVSSAITSAATPLAPASRNISRIWYFTASTVSVVRLPPSTPLPDHRV